ncbi:molybdopterin molybdotransferase MoeA [Novosphingobium sp.]|uniref:molybdopterin molybdotransferase MoeA n=1 Tax=Novosphingobium sp. TaxID=1874826 RepID=UPI001EB42A21|nr:molybdopterin molybdotransferase MoeA [Novosphingobium sp.]MBK9011023.1 molybdopterin molybdotransferase MoeA [Novosphingobium sp.]
MIGFDEALELLAENVLPLGTEQVDLIEAGGRVLAEPIHAAIAAPRCAVSAMDGYALRNADAAVGARLRIIGTSFAGGRPPPPLGPGDCVRIFTGAALPGGADRVVMQENCTSNGAEMEIIAEFGPGWHVRAAASDFAEGDLLLAAGTLLEARTMVTLAAADRAAALVYKRPRVAIVATGDELAPPGSARDNPLTIPESVSFGVAVLAQQFGARVEGRFSGADDLAALRRLAGRALSLANVVVVTGGASVGERDYAKAMFAEQELEPLFTKVAIKPGKPVWIGRAQGRWVVGLPGNPTSALVTARLFLAPLLGLLQGRTIDAVLNWINLPVAGAFPAADSRTTFVRSSLSDAGLVPLGSQDSGAQAPLSRASWLVRSDPSRAQVAQGGQALALAF